MANSVKCPKVPSPSQPALVGASFDSCGGTDADLVRAGIWDASGNQIADPATHCNPPNMNGRWVIPFSGVPSTPANQGPYLLVVQFGTGSCSSFNNNQGKCTVPIIVGASGPPCSCVAPGGIWSFFLVLARQIRRFFHWLGSLFFRPQHS